MSKNWAGGSTRAWRRFREAILTRDGYRCQLRITGICTTRAELGGPHAGHVHHTHGRHITGDDPRYCIAACRACNLHLGDPTRKATPRAQPRTRWTTTPSTTGQSKTPRPHAQPRTKWTTA